MTSYLRYRITATLLVLALGQQAFADDDVVVPRVPPAIQLPSGHTPFLEGHAVGTQNYVCLPSTAPSGVSWTLFGPQATLFFTFKMFNTEVRQQIMTHFLSANSMENGMGRPTWQSSFDTSAVWGRSFASTLDSNFVAPGAIPWLLLQVVGTGEGPAGGDFLTQTTFIHRVNTTGGMAPATGCSQASNIGATSLVPYTADYIFYKAKR
jgi:hypothetical protein